MRLEFEKHTIKTSWFKNICEWILERIASVFIAAAMIILISGFAAVLTHLITQWGK